LESSKSRMQLSSRSLATPALNHNPIPHPLSLTPKPKLLPSVYRQLVTNNNEFTVLASVATATPCGCAWLVKVGLACIS